MSTRYVDVNSLSLRDRSRINIHEDYEVEYWTKKFGVTRQQLTDAVHKVGVMADAVEQELKKHKKP